MNFKNIPLNVSGTAFITISYLPENLMNINENDFEEMWCLHPKEKHKVINTGKEIFAYRYSQSYLNTPSIPKEVFSGDESYMYSGFDSSNNNLELPKIFTSYYDYIKQIDPNYNQSIINWYENEKDYIAFHSDSPLNMIPNAKVCIISFYQYKYEKSRTLTIKPKKNTKSLQEIFEIPLEHGMILTMCGNMQDEYKHGIKKEKNKSYKRISISFRQMKK
jgi:alkylated DNA repair dioxygenase AlkB